MKVATKTTIEEEKFDIEKKESKSVGQVPTYNPPKESKSIGQVPTYNPPKESKSVGQVPTYSPPKESKSVGQVPTYNPPKESKSVGQVPTYNPPKESKSVGQVPTYNPPKESNPFNKVPNSQSYKYSDKKLLDTQRQQKEDTQNMKYELTKLIAGFNHGIEVYLSPNKEILNNVIKKINDLNWNMYVSHYTEKQVPPIPMVWYNRAPNSIDTDILKFYLEAMSLNKGEIGLQITKLVNQGWKLEGSQSEYINKELVEEGQKHVKYLKHQTSDLVTKILELESYKCSDKDKLNQLIEGINIRNSLQFGLGMIKEKTSLKLLENNRADKSFDTDILKFVFDNLNLQNTELAESEKTATLSKIIKLETEGYWFGGSDNATDYIFNLIDNVGNTPAPTTHVVGEVTVEHIDI
jgi:hypothetical protein